MKPGSKRKLGLEPHDWIEAGEVTWHDRWIGRETKVDGSWKEGRSGSVVWGIRAGDSMGRRRRKGRQPHGKEEQASTGN
jgi:hypothetical protein